MNKGNKPRSYDIDLSDFGCATILIAMGIMFALMCYGCSLLH